MTPLGELLFKKLHHVTSSVSHMARTALLFMCMYPLLDMTVSIAPPSLKGILASQVGVATRGNSATMAPQ